MKKSLLVPIALISALLHTSVLVAQPDKEVWTEEQLEKAIRGFLQPQTKAQLEQLASLLKNESAAYLAICNKIHGNHSEYLLRIERLMDQLTDERWDVREQAERTLVEIGARAKDLIIKRSKTAPTIEERLRSKRAVKGINLRGTDDEDRQIQYIRGLVMTAGYMKQGDRLNKALLSSLQHTDSLVVEGAIRALGVQGTNREADVLYERLRLKGGTHKTVTLAALARMRGPRALAICDEILGGKIKLSEQQAMLVVRILRSRSDGLELMKRLQQHKDPLIRAAAKLEMPRTGTTAHQCQASLSDLSKLEGELRGFSGDQILLARSAVLTGEERTPIDLEVLRLPLKKADRLVCVGAKPATPRAGNFCRLFLLKGSLVTGTLVRVTPETVEVESDTFGRVSVPRSQVQGLTTDPMLDRLLGASDKHDKVQLRTRKSVTGRIQGVDKNAVTLRDASGKRTRLPLTEVAGMLFKRPLQQHATATTFTRLNLINGDRILCHVADVSPSHVGIVTRDLGSTVVAMNKIIEMEFEVGGGAMWGFTLLADYSDNRIAEYDDQGRKVFEIEEIFGVWDVECLENGNLLITEFSVNRVREITRKGEDVWVFDDLKNPYDADRLPNGNTLIADTFGRRVIEVDQKGKIVWRFDKSVQPYDVDRLPNGNTLIADGHEDRVLEVNKKGEIVWQLTNMANVHDADRLPNGNTLLTIRMLNLVREVDPSGKTVMEIKDLSAPSDADRLPNGHTLVAENGMVREFDRHGNPVWKLDTTWAVEVNRY